MEFQTKLNLKPQEKANQIDYSAKILLLGSCFAENIAEKCNYFQFKHFSNPFGILFHPKAIENLINKAVSKYTYTENDIFFNNEQWHCYETHSVLSNSNKSELISQLNTALIKTRNYLIDSTHIVITLGTAWVYSHVNTNTIVANCHKVPQKAFNKQLLSVANCYESLQSIINLIKSVNTSAKVMFTISPVRHIKDGFIENQRSKSHLVTAVHDVLISNALIDNDKQIHYFPAYEIMLDELRDYRFYKDDMVHPSKLAIDFIWKKFCGIWVDAGAQNIMQKVDVVQKGLLHKPFNRQSDAYQQFKKDLITKIKKLKSDFPHFMFEINR